MEVGCSEGGDSPPGNAALFRSAEVEFSGLGSVSLGPRFTSVGSGAANSRFERWLSIAPRRPLLVNYS